jgi:hypothetical protein
MGSWGTGSSPEALDGIQDSGSDPNATVSDRVTPTRFPETKYASLWGERGGRILA